MISGKTNRKLAIFTVLALAAPLALAGCVEDTGDDAGAGGDDIQAQAFDISTCIENADLTDEPADVVEEENGTEDEDADIVPEEPQGDPIAIGTILPITGQLQAYGPDMEKATDLAAQEINEAGGVLGRPIEMVHEDSASDPNQAPQAFNLLVNQRDVIGVVGAASSGVTSTLLSLAGENEVLLVTPASTSPALTATAADGFFFRVPPSDALQGEVMANLLQECGLDEGVNTIAVNNDYGKGFVAVLEDLVNVEEAVFYEPNAATFDTEVANVCSGDPGAIVFIGYPEEGSVIMQTAFANGCLEETPWFFSEGLKAPAFIEGVGFGADEAPILAGFGGTYPWSDPEADLGADFQENFMDAYEHEPELFAAESYDATVMIALAVQIVGNLDDRQALIAAMESLRDGEGEIVTNVGDALELAAAGEEFEWVGPAGQFTWDEEHNPQEALYGIWKVTEEGEIETIATGIEPGELGEGA